ncbi:MAG: transposase, partial [Lentisphaerae bacterium]|nr:transposase [Lentisphaerota bacterium]
MAGKKAMSLPLSIRQNWVNVNDDLSLRRQCKLAGVSRSNYYYEPAPESDENLHLMRLMDEQYLKHPEYGSPRMTDWLRDQGYDVNQKRVVRLMQVMGIQAITPGPHTSKPSPEHKIYPYLLRGVRIEYVNQVWSID